MAESGLPTGESPFPAASASVMRSSQPDPGLDRLDELDDAMYEESVLKLRQGREGIQPVSAFLRSDERVEDRSLLKRYIYSALFPAIDVDDTDEEKELIVKALLGRYWTENLEEEALFYRNMYKTYHQQQIAAGGPDAKCTLAPPATFLVSAPPPAEGTTVMLVLHHTEVATSLRLPVSISANSAVDEAVRRLQAKCPSFREQGMIDCDVVCLRVLGLADCLVGPALLSEFAAIAEAVAAGQPVNVALAPTAFRRSLLPGHPGLPPSVYFPTRPPVPPPRVVPSDKVSHYEALKPLRFLPGVLEGLSAKVFREARGLGIDSSDCSVAVACELRHGLTPIGEPARSSWLPVRGLRDGPSLSVHWGSALAPVSFGVSLASCPRDTMVVLTVLAAPSSMTAAFASVSTRAMLSTVGADAESVTDGASSVSSPAVRKVFGFFRSAASNSVDHISNALSGKKSVHNAVAFISFPLFRWDGKFTSEYTGLGLYPNKSRWDPMRHYPSPSAHSPLFVSLKLICDTPGDIVFDPKPPPLSFTAQLADFEAAQVATIPVQLRTDTGEAADAVKAAVTADCLHTLSPLERVLLWKLRSNLMHIPAALPKVLLSVPWDQPAAVSQVPQLLEEWAAPSSVEAMELLGGRFPSTVVRSYAVRLVDAMASTSLQDFVLQLVQSLKYEPFHDSALSRLLLRRAVLSPHTVGHQLFWNLFAEIGPEALLTATRNSLYLEQFLNCTSLRRSFLRQQYVVEVLLNVALDVKEVSKDAREVSVQQKLQAVTFPPTFVIPLNPRWISKGVRANKCKAMDSKKVPLWISFANASGDAYPNRLVIFKAGDDLRQDQLTLQIIQILDTLWKTHGLDLHMKPYGCVACGDGIGFIEVVLSADTIANITRAYGGAAAAFQDAPLLDWLRKQPEAQGQMPEESYVKNFALSAAGYCVATYLLGIGDRHNDNVMLQSCGDLFHIDFGHFLGNFKKKMGIKRETAPFVFTSMYVRVLDNENSSFFKFFCEIAAQAFNITRRYANLIMLLFLLMLPAGIPELERKDDILWLRNSLVLDVPEGQDYDLVGARLFNQKIMDALNNMTARGNDFIHITAH